MKVHTKPRVGGTRHKLWSSARCSIPRDISHGWCCTRSRTRAQVRITAALRSWRRSTTSPAWRWSRRLGLRLRHLELVAALLPVVEAMLEAFDLRRKHGRVCRLGLLLCLARHGRDHARQEVEELLLEVNQMVVDRNPASRLRERVGPRIFTYDRSL